MAIEKYDVKPLFAEPIFRTNLRHAITQEQIDYIKNVKMVPNKMNLISENLYLLEDPFLASIKEAIQEALDIYAEKVLGISQKLYITQSWALTCKPNVGMHGHSHSNSIVSGSFYYCPLPKPAAGMIFDRHTCYQQIELRPDADKTNIFNAPLNYVAPGDFDLLLFRSGLQHFVQTNEGNEPRHSMAINTFVKGTIGDYRDVSELKL